MDAGLVRDFVIIISGSLILILLIMGIILALVLYREIKKLTDSVKETINMAKETTKDIKETFLNYKWIINEIKGKKAEETKKA